MGYYRGMIMVSALNLIGSNDQLQSHWLRRFVAIIIDWVIMIVIWIVIGALLFFASIFLPGGIFLIPFFSGILWVIYSGFLEGTGGATIGKRLMNLVVVSVEGPMDITKGFIRNISKIYGLAFLIDWIIGFVTDGDPRQRFLDRIANTSVVRTDVQEIMPGAFQPPGGPIPAPVTPQQAPYGQPQQAPYGQPQYTAPQSQQTQPSQPSGQPEPTPTQAPVTEEKAEPQAEVSGDKTYSRSELVAMRKDDLTKIARQKNMKTTGTKRDLIDRILGEDTES
jgi:uncharacterized RDD family membrane protein YckC